MDKLFAGISGNDLVMLNKYLSFTTLNKLVIKSGGELIMKKLLVTLLVAATTLNLVACGSSNKVEKHQKVELTKLLVTMPKLN